MAGILLHLSLVGQNYKPFIRVLGGPPASGDSSDSFIADNYLGGGFYVDENDPISLYGGDAFLNSGTPLSTAVPSRDNVLIYKIQSGDTLSGIAANFGVSLNTLYAANRDLNTSLIQPGEEIMILPTSGIVHNRAPGETLDAIALLYQVTKEQILEYNPDISSDSLIIPGVYEEKTLGETSYAYQKNLDSYFMVPTRGWNWGRLHHNNGVDIANACGTQIFAAAEGLVERTASGWDYGYGKNITIEHPNGTKTRYAHLQKLSISTGDYVSQGDVIGTIGNTGNVHGPTGCHLHFEVKGARNPFSR